MDVVESVRSLNIFDLLVLFALFAFFIVGFIQGAVRRLLGIAAVLFSFLLAAALRDPLGGFFAPNWRQFPAEYSLFIAFGLVFVTSLVVTSLVLQAFYSKVEVFARYPIIDELLGGLLGIVQGALLLGCTIIILDSYFSVPGIPPSQHELPFLRELHEAIDPSITAAIFRDQLIPPFLGLFSFIVPGSVRAPFG